MVTVNLEVLCSLNVGKTTGVRNLETEFPPLKDIIKDILGMGSGDDICHKIILKLNLTVVVYASKC